MVFGPSSKAFRFVLDGSKQQYDAYIDIVDYDGFFVLDCRYKPQSSTEDKWTFIGAPDFDEKALNDAVLMNEELDKGLEFLNGRINDIFGSVDSDIPLKGRERLEWIIALGLIEQGNVLSRNKQLTE